MECAAPFGFGLFQRVSVRRQCVGRAARVIGTVTGAIVARPNHVCRGTTRHDPLQKLRPQEVHRPDGSFEPCFEPFTPLPLISFPAEIL